MIRRGRTVFQHFQQRERADVHLLGGVHLRSISCRGRRPAGAETEARHPRHAVHRSRLDTGAREDGCEDKVRRAPGQRQKSSWV